MMVDNKQVFFYKNNCSTYPALRADIRSHSKLTSNITYGQLGTRMQREIPIRDHIVCKTNNLFFVAVAVDKLPVTLRVGLLKMLLCSCHCF